MYGGNGDVSDSFMLIKLSPLFVVYLYAPLGRLRRRWEDNIKMELQEVGRGCGDWTELAQDRDRWRVLVSTVMNFQVP